MPGAEIVSMRTTTELTARHRLLIVSARRELARRLASSSVREQAAAESPRRANCASGAHATAETIQLFHVGYSTLLRLPVFGSVLYCCFVNKHNRNVVADRINAPARDAFQTAAIGFQLNLRLAGGA